MEKGRQFSMSIIIIVFAISVARGHFTRSTFAECIWFVFVCVVPCPLLSLRIIHNDANMQND